MLLDRLDVRDHVGATLLLGRELYLVARFHFVEDAGIPDLEHHRHSRHVESLDRPMLDRELLRVFVDFADFAFGHRRGRRSWFRTGGVTYAEDGWRIYCQSSDDQCDS